MGNRLFKDISDDELKESSAKKRLKHKLSWPEKTIKHLNKPIIWILGGPGSGRGTQAKAIVRHCDFLHVSSGDLLRQVSVYGTEAAWDIQAKMLNGEPVSSTLVYNLILTYIIQECNDFEYNGIVLDGFPMDQIQAEAFESKVVPNSLIIYLKCPDDVLVNRLCERHGISFRIDDNEYSISKRLETFHRLTEPMIESYNAKGKVTVLDGTKSKDDLKNEILQLVSKMFHDRGKWIDTSTFNDHSNNNDNTI